MEEFVNHPKFKCLVSYSGTIVDSETLCVKNTWIDNGSGKYKVNVRNQLNQLVTTTVSLLVAETYVRVPDELINVPKIIDFKNKNRLDHNAGNLEWISYRESQLRAFKESRLADKVRFDLPEYVDIADYEYREPESCPFLPGFYYIPFTKLPVVINREGDLFHLRNQRPHITHVDYKGYHRFCLGTDAQRSSMLVHRAVAYLFCKRPERLLTYGYSELEVNHKDGCKENNSSDNLEWCTTFENMKHAWDNGLVSTGHAVLSRNVLTGEITEYASITSLAKGYAIDSTKLWKHLNSNSAGMCRFNDHVFKLKNGSEWPTFYSEESSDGTFKTSCRFVFIHKLTREIRFFYSIKEACTILKIMKHIVKVNAQRGIKGSRSSNWWFFMPLSKFKIERMDEYCDNLL